MTAQNRSFAVTARLAVALVGAGLVLGANDAAAQRWGKPSTPRDGACFYEDTGYRGDYFCVRSGEDISSVTSNMRDDVESVRLFGNVEVMLFRDTRFSGRSHRLTRDVRDLRDDWDERIASIRVDDARGSGNRGRDSGRRQISSVEAERLIRRAYRDLLDRDPDSNGLREYSRRMVDDGWTEDEMRDAIRDSAEYREKNTMTRAKAEQIVRQAYLNVLEREPDPGSRGLVDRVFKEKWTLQRTEEELKKSEEYRKKKGG